MTKTIIALLLITCTVSMAQQAVSLASGPATQVVNAYDASNRLTSSCTAISSPSGPVRGSIKVAITAATQANPTVLTASTHGFALSSRPSVTISGVTGVGYTGTAINKTWTATVIDANTFSIPFDSSALGAPTLTTAVFTTTAPRSVIAEWKVQKYAYDASSNLIWTGYLNGTSAYSSRCSDAASATIQQQ